MEIVLILQVMLENAGNLVMVIITDIMMKFSEGMVVIEKVLAIVLGVEFRIRNTPPPFSLLRQLRCLKVLRARRSGRSSGQLNG